MINSKELRIGNKLTKDTGVIFTVYEVKQNSVKATYQVEDRDFPPPTPRDRLSKGERMAIIDLDKLSPIPLSPEILEKAGFEKYQWQDAWFIKTEYGHLYIHFFRDRIITKFVLVTKDSVGHKMKSIGFIGNMKGTEEIKQLHQLQNFIYVITGQELTINLK